MESTESFYEINTRLTRHIMSQNVQKHVYCTTHWIGTRVAWF